MFKSEEILPNKISHFINGEFIQSANKQLESITILNPTTEEKIADFIEAGEEEISLAIESSSKAQKLWEQTPLDIRVQKMLQLANSLENQIEQFSLLESLDNGKPIKESKEDMLEVIRVIRYYAGYIDKAFGSTISSYDNFTINTRRIPFGIVGCISPWNYPLLMAVWKFIPAICAGNAVILKPSEETPLTVLKFCELFNEIDFPKGLLNVLNGRGQTTGELITRHPKISKVSFTGSTYAGRQVMKASQESNIKSMTLELGGKSPLIVFEDADLQNAVEWVINGAFANSSQNCICSSRIFIQEKIYAEFSSMIKTETEKLLVGRYDEENVNLGPLVNKRQYEKYFSYLKIAEEEKLEKLFGGRNLKDKYPKGFFVDPTVFVNVSDDSRLSKEEIFAPILCLMKPFKTAKEALERANDTPYGLSSGVFTKDMTIAEFFVRNLQSGSVHVNCYNLSPYNVPFGGMKESGFGRDNGSEGILQYTQLKSVYQFNDFSKIC